MGAEKKCHDLKRDLGLVDIFCIASGAMISSGLFVLPGLAFKSAGPAVILSYAIAGMLIIPAVLSKAELVTAMPKAGGTYFFIDRSMGPLMGTIGGFAAWFSIAFKSAFALVGIGLFAVLINPFLSELQIKLIAVIFCIIFSFINIFGCKESGKTQLILVAGLLTLLVIYIVVGFFYIDTANFNDFAPFGYGSIFSTAGLIFVSYGGLTKICSVAEEVKKPERNLPLGLFLAWGLISLIYILVISVTIGVTNPVNLRDTLTPISLGAESIPIFGEIGGAVMAIAAILAFISTANAGLLAASRNPMAMGKDQLLPNIFSKLSKRGTPIFSIIFTTGFMIFVILFLELKDLVKTASTLKIILFILVIVALIIMRESKIRNYRPKFKSPFYPYVHIAGIIGLIFIIFQMGLIPIILVCGFISFSFIWFWFYARDKIWREYTLLHVLERATGQKSTGYLVDEELREILIQRDQLEEEGFEEQIRKCEVIDLYKYMQPDKFALLIAEKLTKRIGIRIDKLYKFLRKREKDSNVVIHPGIAVVSHVIKGKDKFEIIIVRSKMGIILSDNVDPIRAFFIIVATPDKKNLYLHTLMWLIQIAEQTDFEDEWIKAKGVDEIREIIINAWKKKGEF